ncbi:uncharacterized protein LOC123686495 isoform X1 [Harmonia axyridis]|uniref:uncharacterized protein LOC123686495 isoform X1 n=1 Tax=Harmonia axyridis TaxID=115357 RepID=UPI001E2767D1|nr:uncharacterized protein LOC123686495 isoform X1 [Harmonia axyridis]
MERKYEEFNAKHGPLFPKLKHKDRLNFEEASLTTNKWTTKICKKDVEALPIILEKDELDLQVSDDSSTSEEEIPVTEESDSVEELVAENVHSSELAASDVIAEPSASGTQSQSTLNDEFSCIFTNTVSSGHSVREYEFETMYSNEFFAQGNAQNVETVSLQSVESSSDEEMDDYFRFRVFLPKKRFGQVFSHLQAAEARTELVVPSERPSDISLPIPGLSREEEQTDSLKLDTDITSSECEMILGTMEADFSDALAPDQYLHTSSLRRVARPLNMRYASEEVDDDSVKMLCHATSLMNFGIAEGEAASQNDPIDSEESKDPVEASEEVPELACSLVHIREYQKMKVKPSSQIPSGSSEPSTSQQKIAGPQSDPGNVAIRTRCGVLEKKKLKKKPGKGKMSAKAWWKSMNFNLRWNKRRASEEDTDDDSSD